MEEQKNLKKMTCPIEVGQAILTIREYCSERDCCTCALWGKCGGCTINDNVPEDWVLDDLTT